MNRKTDNSPLRSFFPRCQDELEAAFYRDVERIYNDYKAVPLASQD